ncbi:hypothetical protein [Phycicoccus sonneratiae]|uniref:Uncharacterized protein n=1 Tax=Phycicoccus sonneratiae TaxID=2807628 RepID=A0ABS2CNT8_9MICO|nr:hypothetical protein [Phycicoccus sonneraticus]MBM6401547.1 hypothetical protein [Phycicoccus sonneraticus]
MSQSVVVVPSAPFLLPEYTGRTDAAADLRARAVAAVRDAAAADGASGVVLVVATDREQRGTRPPLGQRVGAHLAALAGVAVEGVVTVAWDAPAAECRALGEQPAVGSADATLVVVADGSARRGEKAPGHLDERAFAVDEALLGALRAADPEGLLALDPVLCADLLVHGRAPLQVAAAALAGRPGLAALDVHAEDPFGVLHVVATLAAP